MVENSSDSQFMRRSFGTFLTDFTPYLMKMLKIVGTAAMFLVGGGILAHGIPGFEPLSHHGVVMVGTFKLEHVVAEYFKAMESRAGTIYRGICTYFILVVSKLVMWVPSTSFLEMR